MRFWVITLAMVLLLVFLSGCSLLESFQPLGPPTITISQVWPLPTGTTVTVSQQYTVKEEDLEKLSTAITMPFQENVAQEEKQFVIEMVLPAYRQNQALKNGQVCIEFDESRIEYLVIASDGLKYNTETECYEYLGTQVFQPEGWHLKLVGLAKNIGSDEFVGTPVKITASGKNYEASVNYSLKIIQKTEDLLPIG